MVALPFTGFSQEVITKEQYNKLLREMGDMRHELDELQHDMGAMKNKVDRTPKVSGFVQGMYEMEIGDNSLISNTMRIRRARLSVSGNLNRIVSYKLQGDLCNSPALVDAFIKFKFRPEIALQAGQFKTPFTLESQINPVDLEIIDYSEEISQLAGYKDVSTDGEIGKNLKLGRDIGLMLSGGLIHVERNNDKFNIIEYNLGVFNGNGINCLDKGNAKDIVGRIDIHPMLRNLTLSGSLYYGSLFGNDSINLARQRWSAGLQYNDGHFVFRGEYIGSTSGKLAADTLGYAYSDEFRSNGYYAVFGYCFKMKKEGRFEEQKLMPVVRFDHFNQDMSNETKPANYYTVGLNYWPFKAVNVKVNYSLIQKKGYDDDNILGNKLSHKVAAILNFKF